MANLRFSVRVNVTNPGMLEELQARVNDFTPAYQAIFGEWVKLNAQKFEQSQGREVSGASIEGEEWAALTPQYIAQKHPGGAPKRQRKKVNAQGYREYPDWLMVRSGALMGAMTDPNALFQDFEPTMAIYGLPNDSSLADIVQWQAGNRQKNRNVIFIGDSDKKSIQRIVQDYLSRGGEFEQIRFEQGMAAVQQSKELESMDANFSDTVS